MTAIDESGRWAADRARYGRNAWLLQPSFWAVSVYRFGRWTRTCSRVVRFPAHGLYLVLYSVVRLLTGIDIPRTVEIGPGIMIHHFGTVIVHPQARIGAQFTMRHGVTIGAKVGSDVPVIGDDVEVGAFAQILGPIHVGDGSKVGAMTLVLHDVPAGATVVGVPGRVL
ncbi:Serine acetyltransferase [Clavibacter michiganensis]|nr:Serine acetyltransferase [Clavibacter michiganensis]